MCGFAFALRLRPEAALPEPAVFDRMVDSLAHRGPDGRGVFFTERAALGHRRLSVLDPREVGAQPMQRGDVVIAYNGEIYNFRELRAALEKKGFIFSTNTDTEVLLYGYRAWGDGVVGRLNGIFAFALFDNESGRALVARDPIGVKPCFYAEHDGRLTVASEIKAILEDKRRAPNWSAATAFLSLGYVAAPATAFAGISQLMPGELLSIDADGRVDKRRYDNLAAHVRPTTTSRAVENFGKHLRRATKMQLVSDVPLGAFLSGGLDSASIVHAMIALGTETHTYSISFPERSFDESEDAKMSADELGAIHRARPIDTDWAAALTRIASTNDELFADSSMLAVDQLCQFAREEVTVALSGDGADEMFAGYSTHRASHLARIYRVAPRSVRRLIKRAVARLPSSDARYPVADFAQRFVEGAERGPGLDHASWRRYLRPDAARDLLDQRESARPFEQYAAIANARTDGELIHQLLLADLKFYLHNDMLVKVDRASMRHGLEVRVPFLDREFVEFALSLPADVLFRLRDDTKRIVRRHVDAHVSPRVARGKKRGFNVPLAQAFRGPLGALLDDELATAAVKDSPLDVQAVREVLSAHRGGKRNRAADLYLITVMTMWINRFL